jgi:hypothetical protein
MERGEGMQGEGREYMEREYMESGEGVKRGEGSLGEEEGSAWRVVWKECIENGEVRSVRRWPGVNKGKGMLKAGIVHGEEGVGAR